MEILHLTKSDETCKSVATFIEQNEYLLPDPFSKHVNLIEYAKKLLEKGEVFVAKEGEELKGICAGYINDYVSFYSFIQIYIVAKDSQGKHFGTKLMSAFLDCAQQRNMEKVFLTVDNKNKAAFDKYQHFGFIKAKKELPNKEKTQLVYQLKTEQLKRTQNRLTEMAVIISKILEENDIPYMITFGTLLGAVRHNGFIPWDDDFDFFLFADSYEKAITILRNNLPPNLFLEDEKTEPLYFHGWAHVKDLNSEVVCDEFPQDSLYAHHGLSVDLYIAKEMKECELEQYVAEEHIAYLTRKLNKELIKLDDYNEKVNQIKSKLEQLPVCNSEKKVFGLNVPEKRMEYDDVFPLKRYMFGEYTFYGPSNADNILKCFYGNYMQLPPKENRTPHYSSVVFKD